MDNFKFNVRYIDFRKVNIFFDINIDVEYQGKILRMVIRYFEDPSLLGNANSYRVLAGINTYHSWITREMGFSDPALIEYFKQTLEYYFQKEPLGEGVKEALAKLIVSKLKKVIEDNKITIPL